MATEIMRWRAIYSKETANGGPDRTGQWVVLLYRDGKIKPKYFSNETEVDKYVGKQGLEGRIPVFQV